MPSIGFDKCLKSLQERFAISGTLFSGAKIRVLFAALICLTVFLSSCSRIFIYRTIGNGVSVSVSSSTSIAKLQAFQAFRFAKVGEKNIFQVDSLIAAITDSSIRSLENYYRLWALTRPVTGHRSIPLILHQTGPSEVLESEEFAERKKSWQEKTPDLLIKVYTDDECDAFVKWRFPPAVYEIYSDLPRTVMKADMFRYLVVLAEGGVYSDSDTNCLKPIPEWIDGIDSSLIVGVEADLSDANLPEANSLWYDYWIRRLQFCQWTFAGEAGHPALVGVVWRIMQKTKAWKRAADAYEEAIVWQLEEYLNTNTVSSFELIPPLHSIHPPC